MDSYATPARNFAPGMGEAVANRTVSRVKKDGTRETWADVAHRVAFGNTALRPEDAEEEFQKLHHHLRQASVLLSGRHLQHGDDTQPSRPGDVYVNCASSAVSFLKLYLLLSGAGVGRAYDDAMMKVDWNKLPIVIPVIDQTHVDVQSGEIRFMDARTASHVYGDRTIVTYRVPDTREGWAKAVEQMERLAFEGKHRESVLLIDFTDVRSRGSPIRGMQDRPASGPAPLMVAISNVARLRDAGMAPWRATLYADHYFAECVLVGGARRAARMATKTWRDKTVLDFIAVKQGGFLWSANNSVTVDKKFWRYVYKVQDVMAKHMGKKSPTVDSLVDRCLISDLEAHAYRVFDAVCHHAYFDRTGEPGFINQDQLNFNPEGIEVLLDGTFAQSSRYQLDEGSLKLTAALAKSLTKLPYKMGVNPCVTADTWIQTAMGPKQVFELLDAPFDALVDGRAYSSTNFFKTGEKPVLKLKTDRGFELRLTGDHLVLVERKRKQNKSGGYNIENGWKAAKDLEVGDKVVLADHGSAAIDCTPNNQFDAGWLLGEMVGDGGYNPDAYHGYVRFWGDSRHIQKERAASILNTIPYKFKNGFRTVGGEPTNSEIHTVKSVKLNHLASGLIEPETKRLLPALERESVDFVRGFVRGFFDADGSVQGNLKKGISIRLAQSDPEKLKIVQRMLSRFGINSTIYLNRSAAGFYPMPDGNGALADYYCEAVNELMISNSSIARFADIIGFYEPAKAARLAGTLVSYKRAFNADKFTSSVVSVEPDGIESVYDCTVSCVHRFDANGIIVHNCSEIPLLLLGAYCVIGDVVPFYAASDDDAEDAFRTTTRALIRTNLMEFLYDKEVKRTNRIGVGFTGIHEYAWKRFGYGWNELVNEEKSLPFWQMMSRFSRAVQGEAKRYAKELGVCVPHTMTCVKPAGTTSKLWGLTEGAHLPSMREYLRWVQFSSSDPLVAEYEAKGYPSKRLQTYGGTTVVGFPTQPTICALGMGDKLTTANEATPEEQYQWLRLLEKWWIRGMEEDGVTPLEDRGGQVSYTLKFKPETVAYEDFCRMMLEGQATVRCCSVMPTTDASAYEYTPEESVNRAQYELIVQAIEQSDVEEDIGYEHLACAGGICPIEYKEKAA